MALTMSQIMTLLSEHNLLIEKNNESNEPTNFAHVTYDSRQVVPQTLFFCKGNFQAKYLTQAKNQGATAYVAEHYYQEGTGLTAIIVANVQQAMALLGAAFYDFPQNKLFITGITGTKGKTTTAYFAHGIQNAQTEGKTALFSTIDRIVGPKPEQQFKSNLTTPESLDLFHDMAEAVASGMTQLIMEVSSQAFKKNRVYGLKYDLGIFLNISPDHIGRNEHPTFADYLYCKEQLLRNSKNVIINAETDHFDEIYSAAQGFLPEENIYLYARENSLISFETQVDFEFAETRQDLSASEISVHSYSDKGEQLQLDGTYEIDIPGDYNQQNALAAIIAAGMAGASATEIRQQLPAVRVPGRMEVFQTEHHGTVYVDYAHNYASLKSLLSFLHQQEPDEKLLVVTGSAGDKGISRRSGLGQAIGEVADVAILTADDPATEDPIAIAQEIASHINNDQVTVQIVADRKTAITQAVQLSQPGEIVVVAGKGRDATQKIQGQDVPYESDVKIVEDLLKER